MAEPFLGEIRLVAFSFAPQGWALCNGQLLPIMQNQALYALLGTAYGGDGQRTFALPDLRGRAPVHIGNGITWGEVNGEEAHTLTVAEMPAHAHTAVGGDAADATSPVNNYWATTPDNAYGNSPNGQMHPSAIQSTGGGQAHENMQPYLVLNFIIALQGIFPSRN